MLIKLFKRKITILVVIILLITAGFGCKGLSTEEKQAIKSVKLEYWTVSDDVDQLNKMIAKYKATRPYVSVTIRQFRANEIYSKLVEALAEDKGPDIVSVSNRDIKAYLSKLAEMPNVVNDTTVIIIDGKLRKETKVNISKVSMPNTSQIDNEYVQTVKDDVIYQNKIYGLPLSLDTMAVYYNKDILDRAGVAEPPKNWTEFQSAVKKITKYDKNSKIIQSGVAMGLGTNVVGFDDILYLLFVQSNLYFTDSNGYVVFSSGSKQASDSVVKVINFYTDYANKNKDVYSWDKSFGTSLEEFIRGKVGFYFGYSSDLKTIKSQAPQLNIRLLPMFQLNSASPANVANYYIQTVTKKSTNQNDAWALINYLTHSAETKSYLDATGRPTALRAYITAQNNIEDLKPFSSQVLVAKNWYKGKQYNNAKSALSDMINEWITVSTGSSQKGNSYAQILSRAASRINQGL